MYVLNKNKKKYTNNSTEILIFFYDLKNLFFIAWASFHEVICLFV